MLDDFIRTGFTLGTDIVIKSVKPSTTILASHRVVVHVPSQLFLLMCLGKQSKWAHDMHMREQDEAPIS